MFTFKALWRIYNLHDIYPFLNHKIISPLYLSRSSFRRCVWRTKPGPTRFMKCLYIQVFKPQKRLTVQGVWIQLTEYNRSCAVLTLPTRNISLTSPNTNILSLFQLSCPLARCVQWSPFWLKVFRTLPLRQVLTPRATLGNRTNDVT